MSYPASYDTFTEHQDGTHEVIHAADINALGDAITAIEAELGLDPSSSYSTVAQRITQGGFYHHTQGTPATTWSITHALGGYPNVSVVDSAGSVVYGDVVYTSSTQISVTFSAAFAGDAYLS